MNKEQVYDSKIEPLMRQILDICKENKIAMVASFSIPNDGDDDLVCTSCLTEDEYDPPDTFVNVVKLLYSAPTPSLKLTVKDQSGSVISQTIILGE